MSKIEKNPSPQSAFNAVVYYLSRRDHSEKELKQKLRRRYTPEAIEASLKKAHALGYIKKPDELAASFSRMLERKQRGIRYINQYLNKKGLPAVAKNQDMELEKAKSLLIDKFQTLSLNYDDKKRAIRYLNNRGFDSETIKKVIYEKS